MGCTATIELPEEVIPRLSPREARAPQSGVASTLVGDPNDPSKEASR